MNTWTFRQTMPWMNVNSEIKLRQEKRREGGREGGGGIWNINHVPLVHAYTYLRICSYETVQHNSWTLIFGLISMAIYCTQPSGTKHPWASVQYYITMILHARDITITYYEYSVVSISCDSTLCVYIYQIQYIYSSCDAYNGTKICFIGNWQFTIYSGH